MDLVPDNESERFRYFSAQKRLLFYIDIKIK